MLYYYSEDVCYNITTLRMLILFPLNSSNFIATYTVDHIVAIDSTENNVMHCMIRPSSVVMDTCKHKNNFNVAARIKSMFIS